MKSFHRVLCVCAASIFSIGTTYADPIPIKDFARVPEISGVSISPDGRYLGLIRPLNGAPSLVTLDRANGYKPQVALGGDPNGKYRMTKCDWSSNSRLLCFFRSSAVRMGNLAAASTMTAVNADSTEQVYLKYDGFSGSTPFADGVIDMTAPNDSVLISFRDFSDMKRPWPSVLELNTKTGKTKNRDSGREAINTYFGDGKGNLLFASGFSMGQPPSYFAKPLEGGSWTKLDKIKPLQKSAGFLRPIAVDSKINVVYLIAMHEGRNALWSVDLADKTDPAVVFSHPAGSVTEPLMGSNGHLLGVVYQTDRPFVYYVDPVAENVMDVAKKALPSGQFNFVVDRSADEQWFVLATTNMIDGVTYYLFDRKNGKASGIGMNYPELRARGQELGRKQTLRLAARDGVEITAQLTAPISMRAENLPLVVFRASDTLGKEPWRMQLISQFLASRGYAVLEPVVRPMPIGGNAGKQNAEDVLSNDIIDATKYVIGKGMVDAKRMCIAGWNRGGLSAYLAAAHHADQFRCAISIAGISDLDSTRGGFMGPMMGAGGQGQNDQSKDKVESALKTAKDISIPVLLIHGAQDTAVKIEQSRRMDKALTSSDKAHKYVELESADHEFSRESDRLTLLTEIDSFLQQHLSPAK